MNSQAQPPRDTKRRRRWPRITLGVVMLGLVVFIAWNTVQLVGVVGDMGAIGDFVLPVDEGQVVASSIATTTQPPPMTEPAPTTTSTSTTTTTFPVGGLGPPCTPSDCDLEVVARVDAGDYIYNDTRGLVGWLLDFVDESFVLEDHPAGVPITMPRWEGSVVAGVLVNLESRRVEGPAVPAYDIPPTSQDLWIATFYFGDHPTTLEPIIADITLGSVDGERANALTGSTCNNVGQVDQPGVSHGGCGGAGRYGSATWDEWLPKLVIGRAYHFNIQTSVDRQVVEKAFLIIDDWRQRTNPCPDPSTCDNYFFIATLYDSVLYGHQLVSLIKGETSDMPLPPGGFTGATMYAFPPLVDVTGPAVVIAVEPDCDECSGVVTLFESASPRMPILVLELNEAEAQRLDIDTFPTVLIVDENGAMLTRPAVGEFTPEQAESLISTACVLLGGCGPVEG